ncbi:MAG: aspartyl-phosphate phosphatase Spo0E family protein [Bacillaceae bacterium]|nr:aspartyl-phosphate phosphatase Spo0E family protein [Bacillaceae bacterium]
MNCSLLIQVESLREEMIQSGVNKGIGMEQTIKTSEELDKILNLFQECSMTCNLFK